MGRKGLYRGKGYGGKGSGKGKGQKEGIYEADVMGGHWSEEWGGRGDNWH